MPKIIINNAETGANHEIKIGYGANLRQAIGYTEAQIYKGANRVLNCRGMGLCAKCIVEIEPAENANPRTFFENLQKIPDTQRMSCRVKVYGVLVVKPGIQD